MRIAYEEGFNNGGPASTNRQTDETDDRWLGDTDAFDDIELDSTPPSDFRRPSTSDFWRAVPGGAAQVGLGLRPESVLFPHWERVKQRALRLGTSDV